MLSEVNYSNGVHWMGREPTGLLPATAGLQVETMAGEQGSPGGARPAVSFLLGH